VYENDDELPISEDAIPHGALRLTEAFGTVVDAIETYPEKTPELDEDWLEVLRQSRELEKNAKHDPETFDVEFEEYWHQRKIANVLLRCALENDELRACVRDPRTGENLQLPATGWLPKEWADRGYVPSGIWQDYAIPDSGEIPGPQAAMIADKLRPIFFFQAEFEAWLREAFGQEVKVSREGTRLIDAIKNVIHDIWGAAGPPAGLNWKKRNDQINEGLRQKGLPRNAADETTRRATIGRALRAIRSETE
jgi:hypothetical protein